MSYLEELMGLTYEEAEKTFIEGIKTEREKRGVVGIPYGWESTGFGFKELPKADRKYFTPSYPQEAPMYTTGIDTATKDAEPITFKTIKGITEQLKIQQSGRWLEILKMEYLTGNKFYYSFSRQYGFTEATKRFKAWKQKQPKESNILRTLLANISSYMRKPLGGIIIFFAFVHKPHATKSMSSEKESQ